MSNMLKLNIEVDIKMMEISRNDTDLAERKAHSKVIGIEGIEKFEHHMNNNCNVLKHI